MFKIKDETIHITRGDSGTIELSIEDYIFKVGDIVEFRVYNKKGLNQVPLINKKIEIDQEQEVVNIELDSNDTKIGELANKETEYWYEIELNNDKTVIGYDENGAKLFILYPEGADIDEV